MKNSEDELILIAPGDHPAHTERGKDNPPPASTSRPDIERDLAFILARKASEKADKERAHDEKVRANRRKNRTRLIETGEVPGPSFCQCVECLRACLAEEKSPHWDHWDM